MHSYLRFQLTYDTLPRPFSDLPVMRKDDSPKEIDTTLILQNLHLPRMQTQFQLFLKKCAYRLNQFLEIFSFARHDDEIIRVSRIVLYLQFAFHELIKFVHVDIRKKLGCQIADRNALRTEKIGITAGKAFDDSLQKPYHLRIFDFSLEKHEQNFVINTVKKLLHITFQYIAWPSVVSRYFSDHVCHSENALMSTLANPTGKRSQNECWFVNAVKDVENGVMKDAIPYSRLVNMPALRIMNMKIGVAIVYICFIFKVSAQFKNMLFQILFEKENIFLASLAPFEFVPCQKQVLWIGNF